MIYFPFKRIFGLIGAPRTGKDSVAQFLQETRGFKPIAFADRIKEEFGISKEDFEAAKIAGNIDELRESLWAFSAEKKKDDPMYFINLVMKEALDNPNSVVITDPRTPEEFNAILELGRIYWIQKQPTSEKDNNGKLSGTKLDYDNLLEMRNASLSHNKKKHAIVRRIDNTHQGLFGFLKHLDKFFFMEDIMDLSDSPPGDYHKYNKRGVMMSYMKQFSIKST